MIGTFMGPPGLRGDVQEFEGAGSWHVWKKPPGVVMVAGIAIGAGAGGGGGHSAAAGNARAGGGGGASGGVVRFMFPAALLPDTLHVYVPAGGAGVTSSTGGVGVRTCIAVVPDNTVPRNILIHTGNTTPAGGGTGTAGVAGAAGAVPTVAGIADMPLATLGTWMAITGQAGTVGGAASGANGGALTMPSNGVICLGGTGGAGVTTTEYAGGAITAVTGALVSNWRPIAPAAGSFNGSEGTWLRPPTGPWFCFGGLGGSSSNAGVGGTGGAGAYGAGGGGGGGGTTGGKGGDGGQGYVQIVSW